MDGELTDLLLAWHGGEEDALRRLTPLVYDHLHKLAKHYMARERAGHSLQATALIHEAYMRLVDCDRVEWKNRAQFFALAAKAMRRILVDSARARGNQKRGGGAQKLQLDEAIMAAPGSHPDLVELDGALNELAKLDARKAQVVELRYFGGLEEKEIGQVLNVSVDTVQRDWKVARWWLFRRLGGS